MCTCKITQQLVTDPVNLYSDATSLSLTCTNWTDAFSITAYNLRTVLSSGLPENKTLEPIYNLNTSQQQFPVAVWPHRTVNAETGQHPVWSRVLLSDRWNHSNPVWSSSHLQTWLTSVKCFMIVISLKFFPFFFLLYFLFPFPFSPWSLPPASLFCAFCHRGAPQHLTCLHLSFFPLPLHVLLVYL